MTLLLSSRNSTTLARRLRVALQLPFHFSRAELQCQTRPIDRVVLFVEESSHVSLILYMPIWWLN